MFFYYNILITYFGGSFEYLMMVVFVWNRLLSINYRPISTLNFSSEIVDKAIYGKLNRYQHSNNMLVSEENALRKGISTETATFKLTYFISKSFN